MIKIAYILPDGAERILEANPGQSVMEIAVANRVPGIDGDCGGACACATCHVYVDPAWTAKTGERTPIEASMLDFAEDVEDNSRLGCQIMLSEALNGLVVRVPSIHR